MALPGCAAAGCLRTPNAVTWELLWWGAASGDALWGSPAG